MGSEVFVLFDHIDKIAVENQNFFFDIRFFYIDYLLEFFQTLWVVYVDFWNFFGVFVFVTT